MPSSRKCLEILGISCSKQQEPRTPGLIATLPVPSEQATRHLVSLTSLPLPLTFYILAPIPHIGFVLRGARDVFHFSVLCQVSARERKLCNQKCFPSLAPLLGHCSERMSRFMEDLSQPQHEPLFHLNCIYSQMVLGKYTSVSPHPWDVLLNSLLN